MENFYRNTFSHVSKVCCRFLLLSLSGQTDSFAQSVNTFGIKAELEVGTVVSSDSATPFRVRSNQFGTVPSGSPGAIFSGKLFRDYIRQDSLKPRSKRFDWGFTLNPVAMADPQNRFKIVLPKANFKLRWKEGEIYVGRRREIIWVGDSTLPSGFFIGSGNSIPIPKVQIATIGYVPLGFTKNFVAINAGFAPFIMPRNDLKKVASDFVMYFPNNRMNMWYLGAQMIYHENLRITVKTSYSRNYGCNRISFFFAARPIVRADLCPISHAGMVSDLRYC